MSTTLDLTDDIISEPIARLTDPVTSHQAAASIPLTVIEQTRIALLVACYSRGPMRDDEIVDAVQKRLMVAASGIRTRRHHRTVGVAPAGYEWFEQVGRSRNHWGRWCNTWKLTEAGERVANEVMNGIYRNVRGSDK